MNITAEGTLHLYDVTMRYLGIKVGISLLSIRSSDIAFTMGAKGPLLEKATLYNGEIEEF